MEGKELSLEARIKVLNAKLDLICDVLTLNAGLEKCALIGLAKDKEQYERTEKVYEKNYTALTDKCNAKISNIIDEDLKPHFEKMTAEDAEKLNEAARRTCEMDG